LGEALKSKDDARAESYRLIAYARDSRSSERPRETEAIIRETPMNAIAISNNDMVYLHWSVPEKIPDCLGFSVIRHDIGTREQTALPAMVGFQSRDGESAEAGKRSKDTDGRGGARRNNVRQQRLRGELHASTL
jgi:hypothetical protein